MLWVHHHRPGRRNAVSAATTASRGTRSTSATSARSRSAIDGNGKRRRRTVRGKTKTEVKDKLDALHDEINAGIQTPATYTVRQCVADWLDSLELDPHTMATYRGQAEKWIYPAIGATKLKDFKATDADRFFRDIAKVLSKASLVKIKSTLTRSIRRAQKYDLIGRNVAELVDLPQGRPGHPSRAMSEEQAGKVLKAASGQATGYVKVVKVSRGRYAATHAATEAGELACGTWTRRKAAVTEVGTDLAATTCRFCRAELGLDDRHRRERQARSAVRAVAHARPSSRRAAQALLGSRGPRQGSHPRVAVGEPDRGRQDAEVEALPRPAQARRGRADGAPEAPGRGTARRRRRLARQQPRVLPRGRAHVQPATRSTGGSAR